MPHNPSIDPWRTLDRESEAEPDSTLAQTQAFADSTQPHVPAQPADGPVPGYRITADIARGGMGRVYAADDLILDREVAIKTLLPGAGAERFVTEAKITARLPHPGIPPVHELGTLEDGTPYLVMKLIRGRTLADLLKARATPGEDLPRFVQIFEQTRPGGRLCAFARHHSPGLKAAERDGRRVRRSAGDGLGTGEM